MASIKRGSGRSHACLRIAALLAGVSLSAVAAHATDGTWLANPGSTDWDTGANWTSNPLVPDNKASFGASNTTSLTFSQAITNINTIQFNAGAPQYFFDIGCGCQEFHITGTGITNLSSFQPVFAVFGLLSFENASTAAAPMRR